MIKKHVRKKIFKAKFLIEAMAHVEFLYAIYATLIFELQKRNNEKSPTLYHESSLHNNYFLTWISAQVKEMGGFVFRNCEIHFSRVFWV